MVRGDTRRPSFTRKSLAISLLAPGRILARHRADQTLKVARNSRAAHSALPSPEELVVLALPTGEGSGRYHHRCHAPIEPAAEQYQGHLAGGEVRRGLILHSW